MPFKERTIFCCIHDWYENNIPNVKESLEKSGSPGLPRTVAFFGILLLSLSLPPVTGDSLGQRKLPPSGCKDPGAKCRTNAWVLPCCDSSVCPETDFCPPSTSPTTSPPSPTAPTTDPPTGGLTPIDIFGTWHCGDDYCTWLTVRDINEFDQKNHWIIDRGDGFPSVNLVILSFVQPMTLLNAVGNPPLDGLQPGMTQEIVDYFKDVGIRVMLSIGGITYVDFWDEALDVNATQLGLNAAAVATALGVGIEIDYEQNTNPNLDGLQQFIDAYRSVHPYDPSGVDHSARLTIDVAAGDRYLIDINRKATEDWIPTNQLDYANAMVTARPYKRSSQATSWWQEHVDGKPQYDPPVPPLPPAKFTGSLWLTSNSPLANCVDFANSHQAATANFVQTVAPHPSFNSSYTSGMLGFMFWSAECQGTRSLCTTPEDVNTCEGGLGVASSAFNIPIPMPPLRLL